MIAEVESGQLQNETFRPKSLHIMLVVLRMVLGGLMLEAGLTKLISGDFNMAGYVSNGSGPFAGLHEWLI